MTILLEKATRQHTKDHNYRLVLRTIYDAATVSRAELARLTGLTRTTISEVVGELIAQGLVEEVGQGQIGVGRTPTLLSVVDDARHIIAIDITHSEIKGAIVNLRGGIWRQAQLPLSGPDSESALALLFPLIDSLINVADRPVLGIGISSPGVIDTVSGTVRRAVNFNWRDLPLRTMVQARYNLPVYIGNDSHMVALAEYMFGRREDTQSLVAIKVGRGIGAGIVLNGKLFQTDAFGTGEIGHVVVEKNGPPCKCGNFGCLEAIANIPAIVRRAQELAAHEPSSLLHQFAATQQAITLDTVVQACVAGDQGVQQIIVEIGQYLAIAVANLIAILSIQRIVITGRIAPFGDLLCHAIQQEVAQRLLPELARAADIEILAQVDDTVLLGAAALLLTNELGLVRLIRRQGPQAVVSAAASTAATYKKLRPVA